ncbi:MAG TPA: NUDIX domain-containing protein, partial [Actinomycetota bacterium]|nr:NUDIX domain-containing protein [Actinomycetota bacterium]
MQEVLVPERPARDHAHDLVPLVDVVAGGVTAAGESVDEGARRELEEELGIAAEPTFRFLHRYEGPSGRVWGGAFDVVW